MPNDDDLTTLPAPTVAADGNEDEPLSLCEGDYELEEIEEILEEEVMGASELDDDPGAVYHCAPCGVDFHSVVAHLQQYHRDEPVVVDMVDSTEPGQEPPFQADEYCFAQLIEEDAASEVDCNEIDAEPSYAGSDNELIEEEVVDPVEQRTCPVCQTVLGSKQSLKIHIRMHKTTKPQPSPMHYDSPDELIRCAECDKSFSTQQAREHAEIHRQKMNFLCALCNKRFSSNEVLLMHMQNHTRAATTGAKARKESSLKRKRTDRKLSYPCGYCGKEFYRPYEKVEHERIHTGEKPFLCGICGKSFRVSYCLTLHMRTHLDRRPYTCAHCQKSFSSNSVYTHHLLTHSNERKYECTFCGKSFKTLVHLAGHRKSHTRPFTCSECTRQFSTLYALRMHMQLHQQTDKLAFTCTICGATYGRQSALRDHHREHQGSNIGDVDESDNDSSLFLIEVRDESEPDG